MSTERDEEDFLGSVGIPAGALCGAQTARAVANFQISGFRRTLGELYGERGGCADILETLADVSSHLRGGLMR